MPTEKEGKELKCPRRLCGYVWVYGGQAQFYTSCPRCRTSVRVNQTEEGAE